MYSEWAYAVELHSMAHAKKNAAARAAQTRRNTQRRDWFIISFLPETSQGTADAAAGFTAEGRSRCGGGTQSLGTDLMQEGDGRGGHRNGK